MLTMRKIEKRLKVISIIIYFIVIISATFTGGLAIINRKSNVEQSTIYDDNYPKKSSLIGVINLTNYEINNTRHYHNSIIPIQGKIYEPIPPPPPYNNLSSINVAIVVDGILDNSFTAISNSFGEFQINYQIPYTLDVYTSHKIEVVTTDDFGEDDIISNNFFNINVSATSFFDVNYLDSPYIPGEGYVLGGFLRYDNLNGNGIPNSQINYNWYNTTYNWPMSSFFTIPFDGSITETIQIPLGASPDSINLNLTYVGDIPNIDSSQKVLANIRLFNNFNCTWNTVSNASEGDLITITGQLFSSETPSLKIYNRSIRIFYDGNLIDFVDTDISGNFHYDYRIPAGIGNKTIRIELIDTAPSVLLSSTSISVSAGVIILPPPPDTPQPLLGFFLVFFPILIGVIAGLAVYGFYYYKKQDKLSKVANLPLEGKIINLKILKESGRLEESLSYLFNAIYMDLIKAKFGRIRNGNETIRDFAIISVKNLKLSPATIYPFIQKVEEIIYAKPFQITDKEFYGTINLFSPIYFELTGYNFELNF